MKIITKKVNKKILNDEYFKFQYNIWKILVTIILFPIILLFSKKYISQFLDFCFNYQRDGTFINSNNQVCQFNSIDLYNDDISFKNKDLAKYGYYFNEDNLSEFIIYNKNNKPVSCLTITNANTNKWVIALHGWSENKYLALRQAWWFYKEDYNILTFDSMAHGMSYGDYTDVGLSSALDLNDIIQWLEANYNVKSIGLIGNSMGASCIGYYLQRYYCNNISWAVLDCGFVNYLIQCRYIMQYRYRKPWWLISYNLNQKYKNFTNTNIKDFNLLKGNNKVPILYIHGKDDNWVPIFSSIKMYENDQTNSFLKNKSEYLFLDHINHVQAISKAHRKYINKIKSFVSKNENDSK